MKQSDISHWAKIIKGDKPLEGLYVALEGEMRELKDSLILPRNYKDFAYELADVHIILRCMAEKAGLDLDAITKEKMKENHKRYPLAVKAVCGLEDPT